MSLFLPAWTEGFVAEWNAEVSRSGASLRNSGPIAFHLMQNGISCSSCTLDWNLKGHVASSDLTPLRRLEGEKSAWEDLMGQRLKAVASVMSGRLRYFGDFAFLVRSAFAFDKVAAVAARVPRA